MKTLTDNQKLEIEALKQMPESEIDLSDIPEKLDWSRAVRGRFYRPQPLTVNWDANLERRLQEVAQREGTSVEAMVQKFILERTYQEEVRLGILPDSSAR